MSYARFLLLASALSAVSPPPDPDPTPGFLNATGANLPTTAKILHDAIAVEKIGTEEWAGFPDDLGSVAWSTTADVTTPAEFHAAMIAAWNGGAGAAQRHRIRLAGSGSWSNVANALSGYKAWNGSQWLTANFTGAGGVLVTWVGTKPTIQNQINIEAKRIEFRDLRFSRADQATSAGSNDWTMDAGNYGAPSNMPWYYRPLIKFRDCDIGSYWHPTKSALANFADWSNGIQARHFEQIIFVGCKFWRASRAIGAYSCGIVVIRQCDFSEGVQVAINCNEIAATDLDHKSSMADPNQYMLVEQNTHRGPPDYAPVGTVHLDLIQRSRARSEQNGQPAPQPGTKTFPGFMRAVVRNNFACTDASFTAMEGPIGPTLPSINFVIDSDNQQGDPLQRHGDHWILYNNVLTGTGFLFQGGHTTNVIFFNTSTSVPQIGPDYNTALIPANNSVTIFLTDGYTAQNYIGGNILRSVSASGGALVNDTLGVANVLVDDRSTNLGANQPQDFFVGPFTAKNSKWAFDLVDGFSADLADYNAQLKAVFTQLSGVTAGANVA